MVVSMGGAGALFVSADHVVKGGSVRVPVGSTVGAGDSFMAGLLAGLADNHAIGLGRVALNSLDQEELGYILDLANRTAGITVTHLGSYSPRRAELEN